MSKRKKYEEAGGVVALAWKRGPASDTDLKLHDGRILAEVWSTDINESWGAMPKPYVSVRAKVCIAALNGDGKLTLNGRTYNPAHEMIRRHCVLPYGITTHIPVTLDCWEAPNA